MADTQMEWRKKIDEGAQGMNASQVWLLSFTDLFSILLCFFVMLYSMKDPDIDQISRVIGGRGGGHFAGLGQHTVSGDIEGANIKRVEYEQGLDLSYLQSVLQGSLKEGGFEQVVEIEQSGSYLILKAKQGRNLSAVARGLGGALAGLPNVIRVVGVPVGWQVGNWEQALEQANDFGAEMRAGGYWRTLYITGLGYNENSQGGGYVELQVENYAH